MKSAIRTGTFPVAERKYNIMTYEKIYLRQLFPGLCERTVDELAKERHEHSARQGMLDRPWAEYSEPSLTTYIPDNSVEVDPARRRPAIIVCPGGGYNMLSFREAEPIALEFMARGYAAFVLNYEVAPVRYPAALLQLSAAVAVVRRRADEFGVDPDAIAVTGYSAGGHLTASLGCFWNKPFIAEKLGLAPGENKPNAMVLGYPVIIGDGPFANKGSIDNLLGADATHEEREKMSLEKCVTSDTAPAFIWHTFFDQCVAVENALEFAAALRRENIRFELHIFEDGQHGLSTCNAGVYHGEELTRLRETINHAHRWIDLSDEWMKVLFDVKDR